MFPLTPDQHHWLEVATEDEGWCSFTSCTCVNNLPIVVTCCTKVKWSGVERVTSQSQVWSSTITPLCHSWYCKKSSNDDDFSVTDISSSHVTMRNTKANKIIHVSAKEWHYNASQHERLKKNRIKHFCCNTAPDKHLGFETGLPSFNATLEDTVKHSILAALNLGMA